MKDYYNILGVKRSATEKEIKTAFKKASLKYHPDRQQGKTDAEKQQAEEKFKEINEAYQCLSDEKKKHHYDIFGTMDDYDANGGMSGGAGFNPFDFFGGSMFGNRPKTPVGESIRMKIPVTLEELYNGLEKTIRFNKNKRCPNCHGEGGTGVRTCTHCHGSGFITVSQRTQFGYMQESRPCPHCKGTGKTISNVCPTCGGNGMKSVSTTLDIKFKPGVQQGEAMSITGEGNESKSINGRNGDFIAIPVYDIPDGFAVDGLDVYQQLDMPYYDCLLGVEKDITLPNGQVRRIKIPVCSENSKQIMLTRDGIKRDYMVGNYFIVINYMIPETLTTEERELLAKIKITTEKIEENEDVL